MEANLRRLLEKYVNTEVQRSHDMTALQQRLPKISTNTGKILQCCSAAVLQCILVVFRTDAENFFHTFQYEIKELLF